MIKSKIWGNDYFQHLAEVRGNLPTCGPKSTNSIVDQRWQCLQGAVVKYLAIRLSSFAKIYEHHRFGAVQKCANRGVKFMHSLRGKNPSVLYPAPKKSIVSYVWKSEDTESSETFLVPKPKNVLDLQKSALMQLRTIPP